MSGKSLVGPNQSNPLLVSCCTCACATHKGGGADCTMIVAPTCDTNSTTGPCAFAGTLLPFLPQTDTHPIINRWDAACKRAELVGMGKDIWITELDRRGGSSALPVKSDPDNQPTYLNHEIALLVNLSTSSAAAANGWFPLKAILTYELYDEPQQGNAFPKTCTSGNASVNGESCYGLVETAWHPGSGCDQYHSCNFTAGVRKPAWTVLQAWAEKLG